MAAKFLNTALGVSNMGSLAAWGLAGSAAYVFIYLPEQRKQQDEITKSAHAAKLMRESQYVDFVNKHNDDAGKSSKGESGAKRTWWFGGLFGGGGREKESTKK
jgi:hypothetical protein